MTCRGRSLFRRFFPLLVCLLSLSHGSCIPYNQALQNPVPGQDAFLEIESRPEAYVDEEIRLRYWVYTRANTLVTDISKRAVRRGFVAEERSMSEFRNIKPRAVTRSGVRYAQAEVFEQALFALKPGRFTLNPAEFEAFFMVNYPKQQIPAHFTHPSIPVLIKDFPAGAPPNFTGSAGHFSISAEAGAADEQGEIPFHVRIEGGGNIRGLRLPPVSFDPDFKISRQEAEVKIVTGPAGVNGYKKFTFWLSPQMTGTLNLPAVEFCYFNPANAQYETVKTDPRTVQADRFPAPSAVKTPAVTDFQGQKALLILFDISASMLAEDLKPGNRMTAAKAALEEWLGQGMKGVIGIDAFEDKTFPVVIFTPKAALALSSLRQYPLPEHLPVLGKTQNTGTSLGDAIFEAVGKLKALSCETKEILLITDGGDNVGYYDPLTAADLAHEAGIPIHAMVLGKEGLVPYPVIDPQKGRTLIHADTSIYEPYVAEISRATGGKYFRIYNEAELKQAFTALAAQFNAA